MANYDSPAAFRQALKDRLKRKADARGMLYSRYRQLVLFERFAARLHEACGEALVLKGGFVVELRCNMARTTEDVDALIQGDVDEYIEKIRTACSTQKEDTYLSFELGEPSEVSEHHGEQVVYEAKRVDVQAQLANQDFGEPFHLDLSAGEPIIRPPDKLTGIDLFEFANIPPVEHMVYPPETHIAEKLHAWSLPRDRENSRAKDLIDIALLATTIRFDTETVHKALMQTFQARDTHDIPSSVPDYPDSWQQQYKNMKKDAPLPWDSLAEAHQITKDFLGPIIQGKSGLEWSPNDISWNSVH